EGGVDLVVEVVEESGGAPESLVLAEVAGVPADRCLDRERVAAKRLRLRVRGERFPGAFAGYFHEGEVGYPPPLAPPSEDRTTVNAAISRIRWPDGGFRHRGRAAAFGVDPRGREQERGPADRGRLPADRRDRHAHQCPGHHGRRDD